MLLRSLTSSPQYAQIFANTFYSNRTLLDKKNPYSEIYLAPPHEIPNHSLENQPEISIKVLKTEWEQPLQCRMRFTPAKTS